MITKSETIWYPGIYTGRIDDEYQTIVGNFHLTELTRLIQERAEEDGQWTIDYGFIGASKIKMLKMIEFVADPENIALCFIQLREERMFNKTTIDKVCRDLAIISKWAVNG